VRHGRIKPKNGTSMAKATKYLGNDWENAVVKVMDNGDWYVRFFHDLSEFKAHPSSGSRFRRTYALSCRFSQVPYN